MSSTALRERTFLRVKRRRDENPPSTIRLELLGGWNVRRQDENDAESNNNHSNSNINNRPGGGGVEDGHDYSLRSSSTVTLADSRHSGMSNSTTQTTNVTTTTTTTASNNNVRSRNTAAAIWKRVEELDGDYSALTSVTPGMGEKRCRVVDALLENDSRSSKRRKLTVLGEAKTDDANNNNNNNFNMNNRDGPFANKKKNHGTMYRILDPVTRLVDDSLLMTHAGDRTVAQHFSFITTDARLATHSRKWLAYRNRGGNLLHACAQWNDVELAHDLLRKALPGVSDAVDEDGRTPYETAQQCGHQSIVEVLEAFGADTTNFVYDMFAPEEIEVETLESSPQQQQQAEDTWNPFVKTAINSDNIDNFSAGANNSNGVGLQHQPTTTAPDFALLDASRLLELQGGVGYWTEDGELILEVEPHHMVGVTAEYEHDTDDGEEDIDSNCEDYGGNDYPDEDESWEEEFLHEEPQIGDDDDSLVYGGYDNAW